jgi:hypothetical protein
MKNKSHIIDRSPATSRRRLFAALTDGFNVRICEALPDGSLRALLWSKVTRTERQRGQGLVELLTAGKDFCALRSPNEPKTAEVATELQEFVAGLERRHGVRIWVR